MYYRVVMCVVCYHDIMFVLMSHYLICLFFVCVRVCIALLGMEAAGMLYIYMHIMCDM